MIKFALWGAVAIKFGLQRDCGQIRALGHTHPAGCGAVAAKFGLQGL